MTGAFEGKGTHSAELLLEVLKASLGTMGQHWLCLRYWGLGWACLRRWLWRKSRPGGFLNDRKLGCDWPRLWLGIVL